MKQGHRKCTFCDKQFSGVLCYKQHVQSEKHKRKVKLHNLSSAIQLVPDHLFCSSCEMHFTGRESAEQHYKGKIHNKIVSRTYEKRDSNSENEHFNDQNQKMDFCDLEGMAIFDRKVKEMPQDYCNCTFCDKLFIGIECYIQHIESEKHKRKVKLHNLSSGNQLVPDDLFCSSCEVHFTGGESTEQHYKGKIHNKVVSCTYEKSSSNTEGEHFNDQDQTIDFCDHEGMIILEKKVKEMQKGYCNCMFCDKLFHGMESYKQHVESEKHKKKVKLHNLSSVNQLVPDDLFCSSCEMHFTGRKSAEQHYKGKRHNRAVSCTDDWDADS